MRIMLIIVISLISFCNFAFSKEKLLPNTLLEIKVIENWEPVKNFQKFKEYSQKLSSLETSREALPTAPGSSRRTSGGSEGVQEGFLVASCGLEIIPK